MLDSGGDSWYNQAWIKIQSANGNVVFKGMMTATSTDNYLFSLYAPIMKGAAWKYAAEATGSWTAVDYPIALG